MLCHRLALILSKVLREARSTNKANGSILSRRTQLRARSKYQELITKWVARSKPPLSVHLEDHTNSSRRNRTQLVYVNLESMAPRAPRASRAPQSSTQAWWTSEGKWRTPWKLDNLTWLSIRRGTGRLQKRIHDIKTPWTKIKVIRINFRMTSSTQSRTRAPMIPSLP